MFFFLWKFRTEILLAIQLAKMLRKTARDVTRDYIRHRLKERLRRQVFILVLELALFAVAWGWQEMDPSPASRHFATYVLWGVTLYNITDLLFFTVPELLEIRRILKGKVGYALKYLLRISLVAELMQGNLFFLILCGVLAFLSRNWVGIHFSYGLR